MIAQFFDESEEHPFQDFEIDYSYDEGPEYESFDDKDNQINHLPTI